MVKNGRLQQLAHRITVATEGAEEAVDLKADNDVEHAAELMTGTNSGRNRQASLDFFGKTGQCWFQGPAGGTQLIQISMLAFEFLGHAESDVEFLDEAAGEVVKTVDAKRTKISDPKTGSMMIGTVPSIAAAAVSRIGRKRTTRLSMIASNSERPRESERWMKSTKRIESRVTIPAKAIMPIMPVAVK